MSTEENNPWKKRFERERQARKESEALLEQKSFELWEINQSLEKQVEERTHSLNKALLQSKNADMAKSAFLANISHEVRTPLNAIIGFSDVLKSDEHLNPQNKKYASIIESSAKSLLGIINDILDISKIENGNFDINLDITNLFNIAEDVIELFSNKASQKNIQLIFNIDHNIPTHVETDGVRIRQVLSNLISNAIKFTPDLGKIHLNIELLKHDFNEVTIRFEIVDTGIGIPQEKQENIFQPFIQVDHASNREYEGTGLGLSISSHIIESLDSKIHLESEIGVGTRFWFDLTCKESLNVGSTESHYVQNLTLLLDDSSSSLTQYINKYLKLFGNTTTNALKEEPDVIVFDLGENSTTKLEQLRQSHKETPKLILVNENTNLNELALSANETSLSLPFYASKVNDALQELLRIEVQKTTKSNNSTYTFNGNILIAEDNYANQELIKLILNKMQLNFTIVEDGLQAVNAYKNDNFDLVLMDINLPVMDGVEAFQNIRTYEQQKQKQETPIIALTANAIKGDKEKFLNLGMNDYVSKPIDLNKLIQLFLTYLECNEVKPQIKITKPTTSSFNREKVKASLGLDDEIVNMLIENFHSDIDKDMKELQSFINESNQEQIKAKAHYIKNSCLNLLLNDEVKLLETIEHNASDQEKIEELYLSLAYCIKAFEK